MTKLHLATSAIAIGAALTGCAATPNFPVSQPPPAQAQAPAPTSDLDAMTAPQSEPTPQASPSQAIQSGPLPPPAPRAPAPVASPQPPAYPPAYREPEREPARPAPKPLVAGKVVTDAPPPLKVAKGDTLLGISRKSGVPLEVLARTNGLKAPYALKAGQRIKLPSKRYYTVQSGDTLYGIAKRFTLEAADLAEFNEVTLGTAIRAGQKVYLPAEAKDKGPLPAPRQAAPPPRPRRPAPPAYVPPPYTPPAYAPAPPPAYAPPAYALPPVQPRPESVTPRPPPVEVAPPTPRAPIPYRSINPSTTPAPMRPQPPEASIPLTDAQVAAAGRGRFVWPVRGDVLSRFGPTGGGQRNDGVNISASPGEGVRAAAAGDVVYAGNQVPGFGNLVLIKHDGGWVTAYAHLSTIDVKMRQAISQGQIIGQAGQTGTVDQPQLHFEIRYAPTPKDKARPVDPILVLPR